MCWRLFRCGITPPQVTLNTDPMRSKATKAEVKNYNGETIKISRVVSRFKKRLKTNRTLIGWFDTNFEFDAASVQLFYFNIEMCDFSELFLFKKIRLFFSMWSSNLVFKTFVNFLLTYCNYPYLTIINNYVITYSNMPYIFISHTSLPLERSAPPNRFSSTNEHVNSHSQNSDKYLPIITNICFVVWEMLWYNKFFQPLFLWKRNHFMSSWTEWVITVFIFHTSFTIKLSYECCKYLAAERLNWK